MKLLAITLVTFATLVVGHPAFAQQIGPLKLKVPVVDEIHEPIEDEAKKIEKPLQPAKGRIEKEFEDQAKKIEKPLQPAKGRIEKEFEDQAKKIDK